MCQIEPTFVKCMKAEVVSSDISILAAGLPHFGQMTE
jgi:hypothetical protein